MSFSDEGEVMRLSDLDPPNKNPVMPTSAVDRSTGKLPPSAQALHRAVMKMPDSIDDESKPGSRGTIRRDDAGSSVSASLTDLVPSSGGRPGVRTLALPESNEKSIPGTTPKPSQPNVAVSPNTESRPTTTQPFSLTSALQSSLKDLPNLPPAKTAPSDLVPIRLASARTGTSPDTSTDEQTLEMPKERSAPPGDGLAVENSTPNTQALELPEPNERADGNDDPLPPKPDSSGLVVVSAGKATQSGPDKESVSAITMPAEVPPPAEPTVSAQPSTESPSVESPSTESPSVDSPSALSPSATVSLPKPTTEPGALPDAQGSTVAATKTEWSETELYESLIARLGQDDVELSPAEKQRRQIIARHLMVLSGNMDRARTPMNALSENEQLYLENQLEGLWMMIDPEGHPSTGRRISQALPKFRDATRHMSAATDALDVKNLEFCTEIEAYGQIKPFAGNRFQPGQQVILYCEVENFVSENTGGRFHTHLQGTYDVFDSNGEKVVSQLLPADQQASRNHIRDYFIAYQMHLPKKLQPGSYRLQLTMEDVYGRKYGQESIPLEIAPAGN